MNNGNVFIVKDNLSNKGLGFWLYYLIILKYLQKVYQVLGIGIGIKDGRVNKIDTVYVFMKFIIQEERGKIK